MSSVARLTGGSDSFKKAEENTFEGTRLSMFKDPDVRPVFLNLKKPITGFILPGFNEALGEYDESRQSSHCMYRDLSRQDPETGNPAFTSWFVTVPGYNFYGKGKNTFISPRAIANADPIFDCRMAVYARRDAGDTSLMSLVTRPETLKEIHVLPGTMPLTLLNVVCPPTNEKEKDQSVRNRVLVIKKSAAKKLFADLDKPRPVSVPTPVDSDWPTFLYGDVTNPKHALFFQSVTEKLETGTDYPALSFGKVVFVDQQTMRVDCNATPIADQYMQGRYDLCDLNNTIYIPSYDELVELLVDEGLVPYDLIVSVCADKVNRMPAKKVETTISTPTYAPADPAPAPQGYAPVASAPMPPAPASAPAPAPAAVEREFWVTNNGQTQSMTESQLKEFHAAGFDGPVMLKTDSAWSTLEHYGLKAVAPAPAPAPVQEAPAPAPAPAPAEEKAPEPVTTAPMPSAAPAPASAPASAPAPAANVACRTAEQEEKLKSLLVRVTTMEPPLGPEELQEFSTLRAMAPYQG